MKSNLPIYNDETHAWLTLLESHSQEVLYYKCKPKYIGRQDDVNIYQILYKGDNFVGFTTNKPIHEATFLYYYKGYQKYVLDNKTKLSANQIQTFSDNHLPLHLLYSKNNSFYIDLKCPENENIDIYIVYNINKYKSGNNTCIFNNKIFKVYDYKLTLDTTITM